MIRWVVLFFVMVSLAPAASTIGLEALGQENTPLSGAMIRKGFSYGNPAILAWEDKTTFTGMLNYEGVVASEGDESILSQTFGVPSLAMGIPLGFLGAVGVGLNQHYSAIHQVSYTDSVQGVDGDLKYNGSLFEVVPTYALRLPWIFRDFSVGLNTRFVFGRSKRTLAMSGSSSGLAPTEQWAFENVTLTQKVEGNWESKESALQRMGASVHYHRKNVDYYVGFVAPYTLQRELTYQLQFSDTDTLRPQESLQEIDFPMVLNTGIHVRLAKKQNVSVLYSQQAWEGKIPLLQGGWNLPDSADLQVQKLFSLEYEFEGSALYYDSFLKRNSYRLALWYKDWYLTDVTEMGASLGMGMSLGRRGTLVDISLYGGARDNASSGWDESFWGVKFGFTGVGSWGQKSRRY